MRSDYDKPEESRSGRSQRDTKPEVITQYAIDLLEKNLREEIAQVSANCEESVKGIVRDRDKEMQGLANRLTREGKALVRVVAGACALLVVSFFALWYRSSAADVDIRLELRERSADRITSSEVMHLLQMHASQPHERAAHKDKLEALERRVDAQAQ